MQNQIDDHRLRYLYEAARFGSVRSAAEALDVNPSVVSRQIAALEGELGMTLLERHSRGVRATEAGGILVDHFRRWSADRDDTLAKLRDLQGLRRGHIDLVMGEGFVGDLMSGPLTDFWKRHPHLSMACELAGTNDVIRMIADDLSHIGLVYHAPIDPRIRIISSSRQPITLVMRPDNPVARQKRPLVLHELAGLPIALMHPTFGTRQIIAMAEAADKVTLPTKLVSNSIHVLRQFVKADLGVTLLPAFSVAADIADGSLVALPVANTLLSSAEAQVITRLGRELPQAASQLLRFLAKRMRAFRSDHVPA